MSAARVEQLVPCDGEIYIARTVNGADEVEQVHKVIRATDQPGVFTVWDSDRRLIWIRYDEDRRAFVRALGQADGDPVPCD